jgi:putative RNA 2'-phosphotransferase
MNKSSSELKSASKFLSYVLRHSPEDIGLELDAEGWALIAELINKARPRKSLSQELIEHIVATNDKQRFKISSDGLSIRANQGHSTKVDLKLKPQEPPLELYHGTAIRFSDSIRKDGLKPGKRHHVHLSTNVVTATAVGQRHGKPIVLKVDAKSMHQQGYAFFLSENGVWLTDTVPPEFLSVAL